MYGALALAVRLIGGIDIPLAALHDQACPELTEVDLFCRKHNDYWCVHAWPVRPAPYGPYRPTNERQVDLIDLFALAEPAARVCLCDFPHGDPHLSSDHQPAATA